MPSSVPRGVRVGTARRGGGRAPEAARAGPGADGHRHRDRRSRCCALSSMARTMIDAGPAVTGVQVYDPGAPAGRRVPGGAAVGGDLDAADHAAAGVGGGAADVSRPRRPARSRRRPARSPSTVGAAVSVDVVASGQPGLQGGRLGAHVGEQVDGRLLHRRAGRRRSRGRGCCRAPRTTGRCPRRRPGRRSAPGRASGGGWRCRCRRSSRSPAAPGRRWRTVVDRSIRPAGRDAVVGVLVPLVADRAAAAASPSAPAAWVATVVFRQNRILPSAAGTWMVHRARS